MTYVIYKYTSKTSGKGYIGQTKDLKTRQKYHQLPSSGCTYFKHAIQKYGWNDFYLEIIYQNLTEQEANRLEELTIAEHHTRTPHGYNILPGGRNHSGPRPARSKQHCDAISKHRKQYWALRPPPFTKDELSVLLWTEPTTHIAKRYGMSDNGVARWVKNWGLTKPPRGWWTKHPHP